MNVTTIKRENLRAALLYALNFMATHQMNGSFQNKNFMQVYKALENGDEIKVVE